MWSGTQKIVGAYGIADYISNHSAKLGKGSAFESKFQYQHEKISAGKLNGDSTSLNLSGGATNKNSEQAQGLICGPTVSFGGSLSSSSTYQTEMMLDINGDGLTDYVEDCDPSGDVYEKSKYTYYKVYFNNGSNISKNNFTLIKIPKWNLGITDVQADLNANAINQNNISYGNNKVNVGATTVKIEDFFEKADLGITQEDWRTKYETDPVQKELQQKYLERREE